MRILLVADPILPVPPTGYGGIERIVDSLTGELRRRGHNIGLVALEGSTCEVDAFFPWPGMRVNHRWDTLRNAAALTQAALAFRPDVLHSFARLAYLTPLLPARFPKIMSYQRHTSATQVRPAVRLARRGSLTFTGCSDFICRQGRSADTDWRTIYNFVDLEKIDFVPEVPADAPLLFLSRVESMKGPDLAIEIARRSGRRLLIAGNIPTLEHEKRFFDEKIAPELGKGGIEWIGEVGDEQKNELLGRCAALLVPIQWAEPFGIVFAEALAAGTPVITCARGALPEIVEDCRTGFFINGVEDGTAAIQRLGSIARSACRKEAVDRFSLKVCADAYEQLYEDLSHPATSDRNPTHQSQ